MTAHFKDHLIRSQSAYLTTLQSYIQRAGMDLPPALTKDLAKLPDSPPVVPQPDRHLLTVSYMDAKGDPLEDPQVQRQLGLLAAHQTDLQDLLEAELTPRRYQVWVKHRPALLKALKAVVEAEHPALDRAVELGVKSLKPETVDLNVMSAEAITAMVSARTASRRIDMAARAWQHAADATNGRYLGSYIVLADLTKAQAEAYRERAGKPSPFQMVLDGHILSLPDSPEAQRERLEAMEQAHADLLQAQKDRWVERGMSATAALVMGRTA